MNLQEIDILEALKELLESSEVMTSGRFSASDMERYSKAKAWANRLIDRAEREPN